MDGLLGPGDELPSVRELAGVLGVNMHTVHRAYQELKEEKVIQMRLGQKVRVASAAARGEDREGAALKMREEIRRLLVNGYHLGFSPREIAEFMEEEIKAGRKTGKEEE